MIKILGLKDARSVTVAVQYVYHVTHLCQPELPGGKLNFFRCSVVFQVLLINEICSVENVKYSIMLLLEQ